MKLDDAVLNKLERLSNNAPSSPWEWREWDGHGSIATGDGGFIYGSLCATNGMLVAAMRNATLPMITEIRRLRTQDTALRDTLRAVREALTGKDKSSWVREENAVALIDDLINTLE